MTELSVPDPPVGGTGPLLSTLLGDQVTEILVKKSRFITTLSHIDTVDDADRVIAGVRKEYWDARHNCVALIVGLQGDRQRSSDDGEPSGTAGAPMLEVLRHRQVTDIVAVVTRYFGGVLLGTGGLVRAYSSAVSEALNSACLVRRVTMLSVTVVADYGAAGRIENLLRDWTSSHGALFNHPTYGLHVVFALAVPPKHFTALDHVLAAETAGAIRPEPTGWTVVELPWVPE